jgi:formylglycine-generating enzyme required for sulfatase activity
MKEQQSLNIKGKCRISLLLICALSFGQSALAHNKVVVIPMGGEDAISHPVAATFTNSIGMQFNELPSGSFLMGSFAGVDSPSVIPEPGRDIDEVRHSVTLTKAFRMQTTEVTNAQWNDVIGTPPSTSHSGDNYPVETVSWYDAVYFANKLSADESRTECYSLGGISGEPAGSGNLLISTVTMNANCTGYRLPTEAEWEYAARAGTTPAYANPIGYDSSETEEDGLNNNLHTMGWYLYNESNMGYVSGTKPVGKKQANAWDLYDMHGNVWEWNWDRYGDYPLGAATDPTGHASNSNRVFRGGSWYDFARNARSANRFYASAGFRSSDLGFRLVLPPVQ